MNDDHSKPSECEPEQSTGTASCDDEEPGVDISAICSLLSNVNVRSSCESDERSDNSIMPSGNAV